PGQQQNRAYSPHQRATNRTGPSKPETTGEVTPRNRLPPPAAAIAVAEPVGPTWPARPPAVAAAAPLGAAPPPPRPAGLAYTLICRSLVPACRLLVMSQR